MSLVLKYTIKIKTRKELDQEGFSETFYKHCDSYLAETLGYVKGVVETSKAKVSLNSRTVAIYISAVPYYQNNYETEQLVLNRLISGSDRQQYVSCDVCIVEDVWK